MSDQLPDEVITCLQNARFLHLATCTNNRPHVSLMNYTYLPAPSPHQPSHPRLPSGPLIIMTSNPSSKKTTNLLQNPNVSLLVHDWVSTRPPNIASTSERERSPVGARSSSLANMLMQLNSAAVSSISATINGETTVLSPGTEEERWCKEQHLANNTFEANGAAQDMFGTSPTQERSMSMGDGGRGSYIEDEDVRVVVVRIRDGRISDWKGGVKDFCLTNASQTVDDRGGQADLVNGVEANGPV
ncbi:hypothetical protein LTR48_006838 [Friedmanniomyces endolithicus]|uniref:Pyridoxamine 5'-phosphate oxidase N-terminal domain-containing protein n=1 Tax=Rachicladosporium monterosium TaxID=1507873 RepID=A0ABR0KXX2_9PEZI|nr:hypothetical protein LTR29_012304 [Friedmanniomyces endolithicus]KAK1091171.1 hypothetical protein LTR48_006838 [Friedmanniomyces endolithicus]KAK5140354.1 hypothetical protein LTR32_006819 [Rachicladosporium monterosium]